MVKTTVAKLTNNIGVQVGETKFLPNGSEGYIYQLPHIANWIVKMMKKCNPDKNIVYKHDDKIFLKDFLICINSDTSDRINWSKYKNGIHYFVKKELNIDINERYWTNGNIWFDFQKFNIEVFMCM